MNNFIKAFFRITFETTDGLRFVKLIDAIRHEMKWLDKTNRRRSK